MNVALINPKTDVENMRMLYDRHENLALGLLSSYLKHNSNHNIYVYDLRVDELNIDELITEIKNKKIDIIAISVNYVTLPQSIEIAQEVKFFIKKIRIIFGGEHVTYLDKEILEQYGDYIDFIVRGEAEITTLELVNSIAMGTNNLNNIKSISYKNNNDSQNSTVIRTPNREAIGDINLIPFADRAIAKRAIRKGKKIEIGILTQRGCPFPCAFCNANRFLSNDTTKGIVRTRTAKNIVDEMEQLSEIIYKNKTFLRFYDATFITKAKHNRKWIDEFCSELENRDIKVPFDVFIRSSSFDFTKDSDIKLIKRLKKVGLISTYIGLESGNDETLKLYNKKIVANESEIAVNFLNSIGISGSTNGTMTFHQDVKIKDIKESIDFLLRLRLCSFWNCISRAETLPGILLETVCFPRRTCWDVFNYEFKDKKISKLYEILSTINKQYKVIRLEDKLIRELRDRIKIELFYNESSIDFEKIKNELENEILKLQTLTNLFIHKIIDLIENNNIVKNNTIKRFIAKFEQQLSYINQKYGWVLSDKYEDIHYV